MHTHRDLSQTRPRFKLDTDLGQTVTLLALCPWDILLLWGLSEGTPVKCLVWCPAHVHAQHAPDVTIIVYVGQGRNGKETSTRGSCSSLRSRLNGNFHFAFLYPSVVFPSSHSKKHCKLPYTGVSSSSVEKSSCIWVWAKSLTFLAPVSFAKQESLSLPCCEESDEMLGVKDNCQVP